MRPQFYERVTVSCRPTNQGIATLRPCYFMRKCRGVRCTLQLENCLSRKGEAKRATLNFLSHVANVFVVLTAAEANIPSTRRAGIYDDY